MKELVKFTLEDGETVVYVEADQEPRAGARKVGRTKEGKEPDDGGPFMDALERIKPAADAVIRSFRELNTPDEIGIEFALKLSGKTHAFVFSSDTEATFKVALKWENK